MRLLQILAIFNLLFVSAILCQKAMPRIADGISLDKFKRFPHHVNIRTIFDDNDDNNGRDCSGSIISEKWILTSMGCAKDGIKYRIDFARLYKNNTKGSYSIIIDNSEVELYPNDNDDLALIGLPIKLDFNSKKYSIKPIALHTSETIVPHKNNRLFAVMPGFSDSEINLTYGMFRVISDEECEKTYDEDYDDTFQLCTQGWNNNKHVPCAGNEGGGLVLGWPRKPTLVGVFSNPINCRSGVPAIYSKVPKYIKWIESVTGPLNNKTSPPTPTPITTTTTTPQDELLLPARDFFEISET